MAFKLSELPAHIDDEVADGVIEGVGLTVTTTVWFALVQPAVIPLTV